MKRRVLSLMLALLMLASMVPMMQMQAMAEESDVQRYTVLVLDNSGTQSFASGGQTIYTADTAITQVKKAANKFLEGILSADGDNYIAVVSFRAEASVVSAFSGNVEQISAKVNGLTASGNRDISAGLEKANDLLSEIPDGENVKKNVVLFTTGMTSSGEYSYDGKYDEETVGSQWINSATKINLYAYANHAHEIADVVKENANLYVIGLFQTMEGMPEAGHEIVEFFKLTASDLASSQRHYYPVDDPEKLEFTFGDVADAITGADRDGDGLLDTWEENGLDVDADGVVDVPLHEMGADPDVPDIFVEVDWMVQPEKRESGFVIQNEISLAPGESAMRIVYNSFKDHGINLHIDAGPDSVDFVTGKKWGDLSGGNEVAYEKNFNTGSKYEHWNEVVEENFAEERRTTFRHCIFINTYNGGTSSGLANDIPGQYFLVANQQWLRNTGDVGVAGTFMHELGHTLGLSHGGFDYVGVNNHTHYKPNYLSIMNYLFQTSGLEGTFEVNYSDYTLPDLDETQLLESAGVDPHGVTANTGLGTAFKYNGRSIFSIAGASIDYNGNQRIDGTAIVLDLNEDGELGVLTGTEDWSHIVYAGGDIGFNGQVVHIQGIAAPDESDAEHMSELDLETALENDILGRVGSGALEAIGPYTLFVGDCEQYAYVRVKNLSAEAVTFDLSIAASPINEAESMTVTVDGSDDAIAYVDIPVPIINAQQKGTYSMEASLYYEGKEVATISIPVELREFDADDLQDLLDGEELPQWSRDQYRDIYDEMADEDEDDDDDSHDRNPVVDLIFGGGGDGNPFEDVHQSDYFYDAVLWAVGEEVTSGTSETTFSPNMACTRAQMVTFLWRAAGCPNPASYENPFVDVDKDSYYGKAVLWAVHAGITQGTSANTFSPDAQVSRGQMVTFLYRYAGADNDNGTPNFADVSAGTYYFDAVQWAYDTGVANGMSESTFAPENACTRAQIVTFLYRYFD